jgi:mannitol/fructose-specific phosphotransferase system IIA component (Ntr-type)
MTFWKLFKAKSCSLSLSGTTKDEVLNELVDALIAGGSLSESLRDDVLAALRAREGLATTGVGQNVAIPHVQVAGLERAVASLSVHPEGVEWGALVGAPVHVFFTVLRPAERSAQHDPAVHLEMMRWISRLGRERDFRAFALQATTRTQLVDLLKEMAGV